MNLDIPAELRDFVQAVISNGTFKNEGEVVGEALRLLQQREELREALNTGLSQLEAGRCREYDQAGLHARFEEIKSAAREQLSRQRPTT